MTDYKVLLELVRPGLQQAGLKKVFVRYEGSGDSGGIEEVSGEPDEVWRQVEKVLAPALPDQPDADMPPTMGEVFESLAWQALASHCGGWEIDDGSFGELIFDVDAGEVVLDHNARYTGHENSLYTVMELDDEDEKP